jgi:hypothetical protein
MANKHKEQRWKKKEPCRNVTTKAQPGLFAGNAGEQTNGDVQCRIWGCRINTAACSLQQSREPGNCFGCAQFKQ